MSGTSSPANTPNPLSDADPDTDTVSHPLRCWLRAKLPDSIVRDALLMLTDVAHDRAMAFGGDGGEGDARWRRSEAVGTPTQWRTVAAGVAVGDAAALLTLGRALLEGPGSLVREDAGRTALRLAVHLGTTRHRTVAAAELLLQLQGISSEQYQTRSGPALRLGPVLERLRLELRRAAAQGKPDTSFPMQLVHAWLQVAGELHGRGMTMSPSVPNDLRAAANGLLVALQTGAGGAAGDGKAGTAVRGIGRGSLSHAIAAAGQQDVPPLSSEDVEDADDRGSDPATLTPFPTYAPNHFSENRATIGSAYASLGRAMRLVTAPSRTRADAVLDGLAAEMPGYAELLDRIADHLALARRTSSTPVLRLPPLLLVGPPGIGKTTFLRRLAEVLDLPMSMTGLGGSTDSRELSGTARGWSSAHPAWPVVQLVRHRTANPLLVLDEIDKAGGGNTNGRAHDAVLGLLEPSTAARYEDPCLGGPIDLSAINWAMTANDISALPSPLRSRVVVVTVRPPAADQVHVLLRGMLRDIAAALGLADPRLLPALPAGFVVELSKSYATHLDPRRLRRGVERALALAARREEDMLAGGECPGDGSTGSGQVQ